MRKKAFIQSSSGLYFLAYVVSSPTHTVFLSNWICLNTQFVNNSNDTSFSKNSVGEKQALERESLIKICAITTTPTPTAKNISMSTIFHRTFRKKYHNRFVLNEWINENTHIQVQARESDQWNDSEDWIWFGRIASRRARRVSFYRSPSGSRYKKVQFNRSSLQKASKIAQLLSKNLIIFFRYFLLPRRRR